MKESERKKRGREGKEKIKRNTVKKKEKLKRDREREIKIEKWREIKK